MPNKKPIHTYDLTEAPIRYLVAEYDNAGKYHLGDWLYALWGASDQRVNDYTTESKVRSFILGRYPRNYLPCEGL